MGDIGAKHIYVRDARASRLCQRKKHAFIFDVSSQLDRCIASVLVRYRTIYGWPMTTNEHTLDCFFAPEENKMAEKSRLPS